MKSRKSLVRELDKAFSDFIRERDGWRCVTCGETDRDLLDAGHLFTRDSHAVRWLENNAACQCKACNALHESDPYPLTAWFLDKYGRKAYDELHRLSFTIAKFSNDVLQQGIKNCRNKRAELSLWKQAVWN